jgi:hypothetical protein
MAPITRADQHISADGRYVWDGTAWRERTPAGMVVAAPTAPVIAYSPPEPKNKNTAILLAVFLGGWAWLYTYRRDAAFFWINAAIGFFTAGLWWISVAWVWSIVHVCIRPHEYYAQFPNHHPPLATASLPASRSF